MLYAANFGAGGPHTQTTPRLRIGATPNYSMLSSITSFATATVGMNKGGI